MVDFFLKGKIVREVIVCLLAFSVSGMVFYLLYLKKIVQDMQHILESINRMVSVLSLGKENYKGYAIREEIEPVQKTKPFEEQTPKKLGWTLERKVAHSRKIKESAAKKRAMGKKKKEASANAPIHLTVRD